MENLTDEVPLWRGSDQSERDKQRRRQLSDAALQAYSTTGYSAATVQEVRRQAHFSTRSFYELYADKSELFQVLKGLAGFDIDPLTFVRQSVQRMLMAALGTILSDQRKHVCSR